MRTEIGPIRALLSGLFSLSILGLAGFGTYQVALEGWRVQPTIRVRAEFGSVGGVGPGSKVFVQGIEAGVVEAVAIPDRPGQPAALILRVDESMRHLIRTDSVARITGRAVVGSRVVEIRPGRAESPVLEDGGTIRSARTVDLDEVLAEASETIGRIDQAADEALRDLEQLGRIASAIENGEGTVGRLLTDDEPVDRLVRLASQGEATLNDLEENLQAVKGTWPISRYFRKRGFDDRDQVLYRPGSSREARSFPTNALFQPGRAVLTAAGRRRLDEFARWCQSRLEPKTEIVIAAFTDDRLDADLAEILTQEQAEAIRRHLVEHHGLGSAGWFRSRTIAAVGFGNQPPRTAIETPGASTGPRRIELLLFTPRA